MWPFINAHYLGNGVNIKRLSSEDFVSVLENYWIEDNIRHIDDPEHQYNEKERLRAEFIKYNRTSNVNANEENDTSAEDSSAPVRYLEEVTDFGGLPGLEDGFLGES